MKLVFRGILKDAHQLPKNYVPEGATMIFLPKQEYKLICNIYLWMIPAAILVASVVIFSFIIHGVQNIALVSDASTRGFVFWVISIFLHEIIHALCLYESDDVQIYIVPDMLSVIALGSSPISKGYYIFMLLLPNILLGFLPLLLWFTLAFWNIQSDTLLVFSSLAILSGCGDYYNAYNAIKQMPKGSMYINSGADSYWYVQKPKLGK